jgi:hypothetical protein
MFAPAPHGCTASADRRQRLHHRIEDRAEQREFFGLVDSALIENIDIGPRGYRRATDSGWLTGLSASGRKMTVRHPSRQKLGRFWAGRIQSPIPGY